MAYNDHRGLDLDSLEREVARWTPDMTDAASEAELFELNIACRELMRGYSMTIGPKCEFYAHRALSISRPRGWLYADLDAYRYIGQCFWGREQYDSALVYYNRALEALDRMEAGVISPFSREKYDAETLDDTRSMLYGTMGNLYNTMGDIPRAMDLYAKAGAIFEQYGWNTSSAVLYFNIGDTFLEAGSADQAEEAFRKSLAYAHAAGDSLWIASAQSGLGRVYTKAGKPRKALRYLYAADQYYAAHDPEEALMRKDNLRYIAEALRQQRKQLTWIMAAGGALLLIIMVWLLLRRKKRWGSASQPDITPIPETAPEAPAGPPITPREREILDFLSKGYTTPQIAEGLGLSAETVKWYRKKLLAKFDVANAAELVIIAKRDGVI